jgi:hypothetical protein
MGANAQTAVPAFTAGQVLTAAQQTQINTGVPVFATTVTRDAAFGGAGEKALAEGQFAYLEDSNTTQYYDGAAWQSVGVTPGLVCVKAETAFSAASAVNVDSVFTSSYTNYLVQIRYTAFSLNSQGVYTQLRVGGVDSATGYNCNDISQTSTTVAGSFASNDTQKFIGLTSTTGGYSSIFYFGPQLANNTFISSEHLAAAKQYIEKTQHTTSTQYDGFRFYTSSGTMTGTYAVYGYGKTV